MECQGRCDAGSTRLRGKMGIKIEANGISTQPRLLLSFIHLNKTHLLMVHLSADQQSIQGVIEGGVGIKGEISR
jgi:hypothetical protein